MEGKEGHASHAEDGYCVDEVVSKLFFLCHKPSQELFHVTVALLFGRLILEGRVEKWK